jgi:hypothetical protein
MRLKAHKVAFVAKNEAAKSAKGKTNPSGFHLCFLCLFAATGSGNSGGPALTTADPGDQNGNRVQGKHGRGKQ